MAPISIKSVLISESVDPRCKSILEENGIRVTEKQNMKKDELMAEIKVRWFLSARSSLAAAAQRSGDLPVRPSVRPSALLNTRLPSVHRFDPCTGLIRALLRSPAALTC